MTAGSTPPIRHILVLCEGNHCRAPLAEVLLRASLPADIEVDSAGLNAREGLPAAEEAQRLAAEAGLDLASHAARQLTPEMALAADLILVMETPQKLWCEQAVPSALGRVYLLGHWRPDSREIEDPMGKGIEAFRATFGRIQQSVADWLPRFTRE